MSGLDHVGYVPELYPTFGPSTKPILATLFPGVWARDGLDEGLLWPLAGAGQLVLHP